MNGFRYATGEPVEGDQEKSHLYFHFHFAALLGSRFAVDVQTCLEHRACVECFDLLFCKKKLIILWENIAYRLMSNGAFIRLVA